MADAFIKNFPRQSIDRMVYSRRQCRAHTLTGHRCSRKVTNKYCHQHGGGVGQLSGMPPEALDRLSEENTKLLDDLMSLLISGPETAEDAQFLNQVADIRELYIKLLEDHNPEKLLAYVNTLIQVRNEKLAKFSKEFSDKMYKYWQPDIMWAVETKKRLKARLGLPMSSRVQPLPKRPVPRQGIQFQEDNDCPFELRPDTRGGRWCDIHGRTFAKYKTPKGFWCCQQQRIRHADPSTPAIQRLPGKRASRRSRF